MEVGVPTEATEFAAKSAELEQRQKQEPAPIQYHNTGEPDALDPVLSRPTATRRDAQVQKIHKIINHTSAGKRQEITPSSLQVSL